MRKGTLNGIAALGLSGLALAEGVDGADTAWMLVSTALVLLMTPALAFFYGGLVRSKNALNTMMMSFAALAFVGVGWALLGYTLAFGEGGPLLGGLGHLFLRGVGLEAQGTIPHVLFLAFQGTFAIITAALVSGALVERMRFPAYLAFLTLWGLFVYAPLAHWVWGGGFLGALGALDFAGGTVVHINAGVAALVGALVLGARKDYGRQAILPHNVPFTLLGAALLWFGWFGFNAGSALAANEQAAFAAMNTEISASCALFAWMIVEWIHKGKPTLVGACVGAIAGLATITPAAGFVRPWAAMIIGLLAAPFCYGLVEGVKNKLVLDDALDVFAVHGMGGWLGTVAIGIFADETVSGGLVKASGEQFGKQLGAACGTAVYAFVVAFALIKVIQKFMVLLPPQEAIELGLDASIHGERAYKDTSNHGASAGGYARDVANPLKAATKAESQV